MPETAALDLDAALRPIVGALLPGWTVTSAWCTAEQMPIEGALAVCSPTPTRCLAQFDVLTPWPEGESLSETLWHEAGHAWISPLTAQIAPSEGAVMLEEQLIERLGVLLAKLPPMARRAFLRGAEQHSPHRLRARLSAQRARGGSGMDGKQVLAAIAGQDEGAALKILNDWAAEQLAAAGHPGAAEPDGDEPGADGDEPGADGDEAALMPADQGEPPMKDPKGKTPMAGASPGISTPAEAPARLAARLAAIDGEHARVRRAADASVQIAVRARLREIRQDGVALPTSLESQLAAMTDLDAFERRVGDLLEGRKLGAPGARARASSAAPSASAAPVEGADPSIPDASALRTEGIPEPMIDLITNAAKHSSRNAKALLDGVRARRAQLRHAGRNGVAS